MKNSNLFTILLSSTFLVACGGGGTPPATGQGPSVNAQQYPLDESSSLEEVQAEYQRVRKLSEEKKVDKLLKSAYKILTSGNLLQIDALFMRDDQDIRWYSSSSRGLSDREVLNDNLNPALVKDTISKIDEIIPLLESEKKAVDNNSVYSKKLYELYKIKLEKAAINSTGAAALLKELREIYFQSSYQLENCIGFLRQYRELLVKSPSAPKLFAAAIQKTPEDLSSKRGPLTSASMRGSDTGSIDLRESFGQKFDLKLPLHVRVVGDTNLKETSNTLGSVFYKAGGALFGVAQAYANQGNAFDVGGKQLETSAVSTFTLGNAFAEFQSGLVSADKVSGSKWSGSRQAMFLGYDIAGGISPFVQVSARQLSQENGVNHKESGAYVGTTVDRTKSNAFFNLTSLMTVKSGLVSDKASKGQHSLTASSFDHSVTMEQGFGSEGVSFNTSVGLSTKQNTNLKVAVGFSQ